MITETNALGQPIGRPLAHWNAPPFPAKKDMAGRFCRVESLDPVRHAKALFDANSRDADGRMWTYLGCGPFNSFEEYSALLVKQAASIDPSFYAISDLVTNDAVGIASYMRIDPPNGVIEVGHLAFSPLLQQTPAATEAMFLMMDHAFHLGYRRYEWKCDALNAPSRRAAVRFGFTFEGVFRQAVVVKGRNRDTAWYSLLDTEWPSIREGYTRWLAPGNFDERGRQRTALSAFTAGVGTAD